jgi:hypothetical protein
MSPVGIHKRVRTALSEEKPPAAAILQEVS